MCGAVGMVRNKVPSDRDDIIFFGLLFHLQNKNECTLN